MTTYRKPSIPALVLVSVGALLQPYTVLVCTSFVPKAADGAPVYGRTMERGTFDLHSRLVIVARNHGFTAHTPDGKLGFFWKGKSGAVAIDALERDILTDGMNEKGLVVGVLYLPGFAEYEPYDPQKPTDPWAQATLHPT